MEDNQIVELYWQRSESAIAQSSRKYGRLLSGISYSLLSSREDAEECVNDTYAEAWRRMPEDRPGFLGAYLSKIVRCFSINRYRSCTRQKRGGLGNIVEELTDLVPDGCDLFAEYENGRLKKALDGFLRSLDEEKRTIFVRRYFYSQSVAEIAEGLGIGEAKVKTVLFRARGALKNLLEGEGLL